MSIFKRVSTALISIVLVAGLLPVQASAAAETHLQSAVLFSQVTRLKAAVMRWTARATHARRGMGRNSKRWHCFIRRATMEPTAPSYWTKANGYTTKAEAEAYVKKLIGTSKASDMKYRKNW